jgi:3-deoxy-D-manno-octulosonate 8-phosphate phosphatase (KDO 8-P phosphatase)
MTQSTNTPPLAERLAAVRLLAMDVDGVLTDGGIYYTGSEPETKRFSVADGLGLQLAVYGGLIVAIISGRVSEAVERRAKELGITHLYQGVANKAAPMAELMASYGLETAQVAYIGDDWNDLPAFSLAGMKIVPPNAVNEIKGLADLITERSGGEGAVREVCEVILKTQGRFNDALQQYLAKLLG